jgi:UDP-N-acetylmuramoyl-L-alanyl-D-glutamate--2,6-diaminopimelate ligase
MTISELLKGLKVRHKSGPLNIKIKGITYDSRLVKNGFLFVAIKGFSVDGHDYIKEAISRGAIAVVTEESVKPQIVEQLTTQDKAIIEVTDSRKALALLATAFYGEPSKKMSLIGITGTNGKTTTGYITKSILETWGKNVSLLGTINYIIGDKIKKAHHTTPESLDLQRYLKEMVESRVEYAVLEVSSHALALSRIEGCSFKVAAFTNFSQDHLDFHGSMDEYFRVKTKLFNYLGAGGIAVLNWDDPMVKSLTRKLNCKIITCGLEKGAMLRAENISKDYPQLMGWNGLCFDIQTPERKLTIRSRLIGNFNVYNILMAVGIAYALGVEEHVIQEGVYRAKPVEGRLERIDEGQRFLCIIDYAHTEDALKKLIQEARLMTPGRVITVFGCGGDRDKTKRPLMGAVATELSDFVIITSDNPRTEEPMDIIQDIIRGTKKNNYTIQPDRAKAIREAVAMAEKGDTVLIAGKGHEDYQEIKGVRYPFSDREVVKEAIQKTQKN